LMGEKDSLVQIRLIKNSGGNNLSGPRAIKGLYKEQTRGQQEAGNRNTISFCP